MPLITDSPMISSEEKAEPTPAADTEEHNIMDASKAAHKNFFIKHSPF